MSEGGQSASVVEETEVRSGPFRSSVIDYSAVQTSRSRNLPSNGFFEWVQDSREEEKLEETTRSGGGHLAKGLIKISRKEGNRLYTSIYLEPLGKKERQKTGRVEPSNARSSSSFVQNQHHKLTQDSDSDSDSDSAPFTVV